MIHQCSLQLFGATGKSSWMELVDIWSIFPAWGWQSQRQGDSRDGSAAMASASRDICSGWRRQELSLPFLLLCFALGKSWISPSFSRAWGSSREGRRRHIWSGAAAGICPVLQGMLVSCEWLWPFQYSRFWLIGHFPSLPCCKQGSCEIGGQNKHRLT